MKKFKFRLERVLEYRELVKEEKAKELILCRSRLLDAQHHLKQLEEELLSNPFGEELIGITVDQLQMLNLYKERLKNDILRQKKVIEEAEEAVRQAQDAYVLASQEEETLATLKEKKRTEYIEYIEKEELKNIDEMTTQRAGRHQHQF